MSKFSIIAFSGTADKLTSVGILSQAAAAMGSEVKIFVTFWGLTQFTKEPKKIIFPKEFENMAPQILESMKVHNFPSWYDMITQAKSLGAKVYACSAAAELMGLTKEKLDPIVDDIVGAATFLAEAEGGQTLFI